MLVDAVRALGGCPNPHELGLVAQALLRGPQDLADELRLAAVGDGSSASREACGRLMASVRAGDASGFTFLDLLVEISGGLHRKPGRGMSRV